MKLAPESDDEAEDPDYQPPEDYEDVDDFDSDISSDEIEDLKESLEKDIAELAPQQLSEEEAKTVVSSNGESLETDIAKLAPQQLSEHEAKTVVSPNGDSEKLIEEEIPKVDVSQENKPEN